MGPLGDSNDPAAERDFYLGLLELASHAEPEPLVDRALAMIVAASRARVAYVELHERAADRDGAGPRYWRAHGCSDEKLAAIRASISRGIIARALAEGRMIATPSAIADPDFRDQPSVLRNDIQAVLCAPIGQPAFGVIYLQSADASPRFTDLNRNAVEILARQLATVAHRVLAGQQPAPYADATAAVRNRFRCDGLVGRSAALARVLEEAAAAAPVRTSVLITGPAGTGKSALARAIHANGPRAHQPCIEVNCAAIPESLFESELFGAEPGAATGITRRLEGKVAAARGGTLFLDEVAELPLAVQAKLLQVVQDRVYFPLGASAPVKADIRLISATNADLDARVAQRAFRSDLYYRLAVLPITMPGLEERRDDLPLLVERLTAEICAEADRPPIAVTRRALQACDTAPWPGQIRQLRNALEAGIARAGDAGALDEHHIFPSVAPAEGAPLTYREATQRAQRRCLQDALERNDWNITRTATELDLNRQHVHDLIATFGLRRPGGRG